MVKTDGSGMSLAHTRDKVLLVSHRATARVAGISLGFEMLLDGLKSRGVPVRVIDLSAVGVTDHPGSFNTARLWTTISAFGSYVAQLSRARRVYMTVATSRFGFIRDALFLWSAYLMGRRVILHLKGGGYRRFYLQSGRLLRAVIRVTVSRSDRIIVLGELLRGQFRFVRGMRDRIVVVRNGLPEPDRHLLVEGKTLPTSGPVRLLYLSNLIPSKGYWDLLVACRQLQLTGIEFQCDFCGEFVDIAHLRRPTVPASVAKARFQDAIRDWGLGDVVTYHGVVRGPKKLTFLRSAHVFVLPTYYPWEGQPMSIIEAMAAATPVISTRHRGIPEQVVDGYNGFLVPPRSPAAIATAVKRLATEPELFSQLSRNAHRQFARFFRREAHLDSLIGVLLGTEEGSRCPGSHRSTSGPPKATEGGGLHGSEPVTR